MNLLSGNLTAVDPLVSALGTLNKSISLFAAFSLVGVLLSLSFFLIEREGKLEENALRLRNIGKVLAGVWFLTSAFQIIITLANILGTSFGSALDPTTLSSFVRQIDLGRFLAFQTFLAGVVLISLTFLRRVLPATVLLGISLLALVSPVFQSHSASSGSHSLAIGSLVIHVVALSLWVGGVFALVLLNDSDRKVALPRFSQLALWAAIAVVASGLINAWTRLNFASA